MRPKPPDWMMWVGHFWCMFITAVIGAVVMFVIMPIENRPKAPSIINTVLFVIGLLYLYFGFRIPRFLEKRARKKPSVAWSTGMTCMGPVFFAVIGSLLQMPAWQVYSLLGLSLMFQAACSFRLASALKQSAD